MNAGITPNVRIQRRSSQTGRVFILPGIMNVKFHLAWFKRMIRRAYPFYEVEVRRWGTPFGPIANLKAYERNRRTAEELAREIGKYRETHPEAMIHLVGYSGGGGLAVMVVEALEALASIHRLILVAAAVSPEYPLAEKVLPKVREFAVNYASRYDLQIRQGTTFFGNMDGAKQPGAGAVGFSSQHPKLIQVHWRKEMLRYLHLGNHWGYLSPFWQRRYLLPTLDPSADAGSLGRMLA